MSGDGHGGAYMFLTLGPSKLTCYHTQIIFNTMQYDHRKTFVRTTRQGHHSPRTRRQYKQTILELRASTDTNKGPGDVKPSHHQIDALGLQRCVL
jgi:hypothetical protein